jgi:eukaryotic-like serine/threonine-protein kinase
MDFQVGTSNRSKHTGMEKRWIWPFELEEQIGAGAMGVVYRARFVKNDRRVALKLLPPDVAANPTLAARFQREMELLKDLRHPNIVHCFGGTCEGDQWFYAMELVEGGTVASLLQEQGRLPWRQVIDFGLQICAALEYAHERDIIHRDLKPGNLLLTKAGKLKLSDFGLAQMSAETKLTAAGKTVGSLHYMAPEQIQGKPPLSNRTDLYALGCVLYELLTGRPPFLGGAMAEVLQRHLRETPQTVASVAFDCPPQLEALVAELLNKDPSRRPESAQVVARRLQEVDQSVTIKLPRFDRNKPIDRARTETISADVPQAASSRWPAWWGGALALGLLAGWIGAWLWHGRSAGTEFETQLITGLSDSSSTVRVFAAHSLGEIGPAANHAVPRLLDLLNDQDPAVRIEAASALGKIGPGNDAVLAPLTKTQRSDEIPQVRDAAAQAEKLIRRNSGSSKLPWLVTGLITLLVLTGLGVWGWKRVAV